MTTEKTTKTSHMSELVIAYFATPQDELLTKLLAAMRQYAGKIAGDDADDLVQEASIKVFEVASGTAKAPEQPGKWLASLLHNRHTSIVRKRQRQVEFFDDYKYTRDLTCFDGEAESLLEQVANQLTDEEREFVALFRKYDLNMATVAKKLKVPHNHVQRRMEKLRERISELSLAV